jgi:hypothetical protein
VDGAVIAGRPLGGVAISFYPTITKYLNYILTVYVIIVYHWQNLTVLKLDQQGAML